MHSTWKRLCLGLVVLGLAACHPEMATIDEYACPQEGTKLTYENFGRGFLDGSCQTCHGRSTSDRSGAPAGFDFRTHESARASRERIFARAAASNRTMPPGPDDPPDESRYKLAEWLACGAP